MQIFKTALGFLYSIYAFAIFVALMLLAFPFVIIASFFGKVKGGNMIYTICRLWTDIALFCWGIYHRNIFEAPKAKDHVVFVFNHISYMDIPVILKTFRREPIRVLGKAEMVKVPIFGFIYGKAAVTVNRESEEGRRKSLREMKQVISKNISIVIAPEGTFNMTPLPLREFYNGAFKIAVEMNVPVQPVLFLDTYDRLNYKSIFSLTPGRSRAVFLPAIDPGNDVAALKQKVFTAMEEGLRRYRASWIK